MTDFEWFPDETSAATEVAWRAATDPRLMLALVQRQATERKVRLFAVACCSRGRRLVDAHPKILACIDFAERYADGDGAKKRLKKLADDNNRHYARYADGRPEALPVVFAAEAARSVCALQARDRAGWVCRSMVDAIGGPPEMEQVAQADLARDIFGNPFRPVAADPAWRTSVALALASRMYETRDFGPMPILADALQEAGCDSADVLDHCRTSGPHARGCWVVDLLLGKS